MKRRRFITAGLAAGGAVALSACSSEPEKKAEKPEAPAVQTQKKIQWKMVTTWPKNFPGLGTGAENLVRHIREMSEGRLDIKVYAAGELVPAMESFDAVSKGTAEMGHGASYYWAGKSKAAQFFTAVPFGLTAQEMIGWLYYGGGQQLWDSLYADFNLKAFTAGNTGVQMGGWFNREINSVDDLKGLKMRIPGLGGTVMEKLGVVPKLLPGGEIFTSLQSGAIDATEFVGPYNDLALGFYKVAKFYYYPGWHEPGSAMEAFINKKAFDALPKDLQQIIAVACKAACNDMLAEFTARNGGALNTLINEHNVVLKKFPDDVLKRLHEVSREVIADEVAQDKASKDVYASFSSFKDQVMKWTDISETSYALARNL